MTQLQQCKYKHIFCPSSFPQEFKRELYQKKIEIESLNHRFVCRLSPGSERPGSVSPLCDFRQRWDSLESETVGRQVRICTYHYVILSQM